MNFVTQLVLFVFTATLAVTLGLPAELTTKNIAKGDISLETRHGKGNEPVIALDASPIFDDFHTSSQMNKFFANLGSMLSTMSNKINKMFSRLPANYDGNIVVPLPNFNLPVDISNIEPGKANSTSVTKFVNGHKVTINDTDYKNEGANETSFFHVRVVDIHPENGNATPAEDVIQEMENIFARDSENENAIPVGNNNREEVIELDAHTPLRIQKRKDTEWSDEEWDNDNSKDPVNLQNIESFDEYQPPMRDLSNDIYVNDILANSGAPTNPDAELINKDLLPPIFMYHNSRVIVPPSNKNNYYYYDVAKATPPKPYVDLSNDIYVNDIMANSGAAPNPDAELIDPAKIRPLTEFEGHRRQ